MTRHKPILIVDDDEDDRFLINETFEEVAGAGKVQLAENGKVALDYLDSVILPSELPLLIVLDLNMPLLDGFNTLAHLKSDVRYQHIPVVILTTSRRPEDRNRCIKVGAVDFITKPTTFRGAELVVKLLTEYAGVNAKDLSH